MFAGAIAFPSGAAGVRWAVEHKKKVIVFDDARLVDVPRSWLVDYVKKRIYSCADAILCPSKAWNPTFTYFGFKDFQIFYGLNVVDNSYWRNQNSTESNSTSANILTIGRQIPKKNFLFLVNAYQAYASKHPRPRTDSDRRGPEHESLVDFERKIIEHR